MQAVLLDDTPYGIPRPTRVTLNRRRFKLGEGKRAPVGVVERRRLRQPDDLYVPRMSSVAVTSSVALLAVRP
jgi:hypothetical protein